jgi:hypothetical protein
MNQITPTYLWQRDGEAPYTCGDSGDDLRATSHTRSRARDHYTSSTIIGGEGGAGPRSIHTMLEGPTEYINAIWM